MKGPGMGSEETFPRDLNTLEHELLLWVLPEDRPGYAVYRYLVTTWKVAGRGRRGEGNYVLAGEGTTVDNDSPLPPPLAFGSVESEAGTVAVSVRERTADQLQFEIAGETTTLVSGGIQDHRRWTLSEWLPSHACPCCGEHVRKVEMRTLAGRSLVLALCAKDGRLWVYDERSGINYPIPLTGYYNELMLVLGIKDPKIALDSRRLFTALATFRDADLVRAFEAYNRMRMRVLLEEPLDIRSEGTLSWFKRATKWLGKK